ncbi:MAG: preprotein translocase subunit Sec61beta [Nanoarchaeota archaeon]
MAEQGIRMPSSYGGLMRYSEEYTSSFRLSPEYVVLFLILIVAFIAVLKIFWPIVG